LQFAVQALVLIRGDRNEDVEKTRKGNDVAKRGALYKPTNNPSKKDLGEEKEL